MKNGVLSFFKTRLEAPYPVEKGCGVLPYLLVLFPLAVALALKPSLVAMVFLGACFIAIRGGCLKSFLTILGVAFLFALLIPTPSTVYSDADNYVLPITRILGGDTLIYTPETGYFSMPHLLSNLPDGYFRYSAALYRIFGWIDMGNMLIFLFIPVAWSVWRQHFDRLRTCLVLCGPLVFANLFNPGADGATYLLLIIALGALQARNTLLTLAAILVATTFKTTAWAPAALIALVVLFREPRQWKKVFLTGCAALLYNLPFFIQYFRGHGLPTPDFETMDATARSLGWCSRFAYAYLGHWLVPGEYNFNVPVGGFDGGGVDGLGPHFRLLVWVSILLLLCFHRRLKSWGVVIAIGWLSMLSIPTLYMGYARYVPLFYFSITLPFILLLPRLSILPVSVVCAMPIAWLGWRCVLISERLTLFNPEVTAAIASDLYSVRCDLYEVGFQPAVQDERFIPSGSLQYSYLPKPGVDAFPRIPRPYDQDQRLIPATAKAAEILPYITKTWLPWCLTHFHHLIYASITYRVKTFAIFPRGKYDIPTTHTR